MKTIEMVSGSRYVHGGKMYQRGKQYPLTNNVAEALLEGRDGRGNPYFREVTGKDPAPKGGVSKDKTAGEDSEAVAI